MDLEKHPRPAPAPYEGGEGCLTAAIRMPVRIVVLLVVVPVRLVLDALAACGRALYRVLLSPLIRGLDRVWDHMLAPVGRGIVWCVAAVVRYGVVAPVSWLYRRVLTPLGRGVRLLMWAVFVRPWTALHRWVLTPLGHGLTWLYANVLAPVGRGLWAVPVLLVPFLVVAPAVFVYRWILSPVGRVLLAVGREIVGAVEVAWRVAGYLSRAVGRGLKWLAWHLAGRPASWFYRQVCTPVGHFVRDGLWNPARRAAAEVGRAAAAALASARETVRRARRDAWRALAGGPREARAVEPRATPARTLGSTTTAPGAAPAPEISLSKQG
ncbi:hypothetical protein [Streptomyces sp. SP18CS02]|uniref:hypothetical protein n=1 Tax=Streptomyces sp. SP18CS02 TaxID=3002531 RepID=UPI002E75D7D1|nr:hypothetical protein [Streptomyces sp. SP18CS02]MEE1753604.1 hypothetical protein [Streptomyces sp. SP18CS02]